MAATDTLRCPVVTPETVPEPSPLEDSIRRDLTNVVRWVVGKAVAMGVHDATRLFRRAAVSSFLIVALGFLLGL